MVQCAKRESRQELTAQESHMQAFSSERISSRGLSAVCMSRGRLGLAFVVTIRLAAGVCSPTRGAARAEVKRTVSFD
jgi:hypothetical protein